MAKEKQPADQTTDIVQQEQARLAQANADAQARENERAKVEAENKARDEKDRAERQKREEEERVKQAMEANANLDTATQAGLFVAPSDTKPYGHPDPAPGAASYERPQLANEPGSVEYMLAHPGELTSGTIAREDATALPSQEEMKAEREKANEANNAGVVGA